MKLEADEWDYKTQYYENMKNKQPLTHRGKHGGDWKRFS